MKVALLLVLLAVPVSAQTPRGRLYAGLEATFVGLQGADTVSTLVALDRGAREGNPLMRFPPPAFVAAKVGGTVVTVWLTRRLAREHKAAAIVLLAALDSVYAVVVTRNVRVATR